MLLTYMMRTINARIPIDDDLLKTLELGTLAYQTALNVGYSKKIKNKITLQNEIYHSFREEHPELPSVLVQTASHKAGETLKAIKWRKLPIAKRLSLRYSPRCFTFYKEENEISVSTVNGRRRYSIQIPKWATDKYPIFTVKNICISYHKKICTLHLMIDVPDVPKSEIKTYVGVDRGIKNIAVCSDNTFFNSKHLKNIKGKYQHLRSELQSRGTRSAKKRLKSIAGRERRFVSNTNRIIAKEIVDKADCVILEDLSKIKKRPGRKSKTFRKSLGGWSYYELQQFIEQRAELCGKSVRYIDPSYTSQECSRCGFTDKSNRHGSSFHCKKCGFDLNADLNASRNIVSRGTLLDTGCCHTPECSDGNIRDKPTPSRVGI